MSFNELYTDILCASSKDHIVKEPITLACSHGVCKSCLPKGSNTIVCKICGNKQKIIAHENIFMKKFIERNLSGLFDKLEKLMNEEIRKLKGNANQKESIKSFVLHF